MSKLNIKIRRQLSKSSSAAIFEHPKVSLAPQDIESVEEQQHPQARTDRSIVDTLLMEDATDRNLAELARLRIRYRGFPGARDIQVDLDKVLEKWQLTEDILFEKTRLIHATGNVYSQVRSNKRDEEDWS